MAKCILILALLSLAIFPQCKKQIACPWIKNQFEEPILKAPKMTDQITFIDSTKLNRRGRRRTQKIKGVILHHTEGSVLMSGNATWGNKTNTGANYYVTPDAKVHLFASGVT